MSIHRVIEHLRLHVSFGDFVLLTTLPRGGLQIAQPSHLMENFSRTYSREYAHHDRLSWHSLREDKPVLAREAWPAGEFEASAFATAFLHPAGYVDVAVVPIKSPVLAGYPGVVWLLRSGSDDTFDRADIEKLESALAGIEQHHGSGRFAQNADSCPQAASHRAANGHWVFDQADQALMGSHDFQMLDPLLIKGVQDVVRNRLAQSAEFDGQGQRIGVADSGGDLWNFYVMTRASFPALSEGPVVFVCLQPECSAWGTLQASDFQADNELARLVPAIQFMHDNFHRSPTLTEIASTVHLSPFHFHRRFSELLGITPKHFLLDCQIGEAKRMLVARQKELSELATLCGFAHQSHFTSRFKQATGLTPTRWRRLASDRGSGDDRLSPRSSVRRAESQPDRRADVA